MAIFGSSKQTNMFIYDDRTILFQSTKAMINSVSKVAVFLKIVQKSLFRVKKKKKNKSSKLFPNLWTHTLHDEAFPNFVTIRFCSMLSCR